MISISQANLGFLSDSFWHGFLVFLRVSAIVSVLPAFGESSVPVRVKLGLAVAFTAIVASAVSPIGIPLTPVELFAFTAAEIIVGLALGLAIRLFVMALQTAGAMAAQSTSLSQIMGSAGVEPMPAMGHVLVVAGLALAVMTGLHVRVAELLIKSYSVFPAGHFPDPRSLTWWGMVRVAKAFTLAFSLAAPFLIASMLYNLTLGVINRAMPQLMVAFIGAPVITLGGLFLLVLCTPLMLHVWAEALASFISDPIGAGQ